MRIDYTDYKKQQEEIKYLSYHDNLTNLYNRTFMEEEMKRLDSSRQLPISIVMIDVNGLKLFNDTYGHQKGDQLLIKTADILKKSTRSEDIVARWAGDEFVIMLPKTSITEMGKIINRIEANCSQTEDDEILISLAVGAAVKEKIEENIFDVFDQADKEMYKQKMSKSRKAKQKLVENILINLESKSSEERGHLDRMKSTAAKFADFLGLKKDEKERLENLAELHDLGKVTIAEEILKKEDKLSKEEWAKVKEHSEHGYKIAAASKEFASIAKEILHHHEHWDGNGYPTALAKEEIPLLARIISIIDAFDVMRNKNIYSKKMTRQEAIKELKSCAGTQFDPLLTEKFIEFIS
jgi:diguanylate cyclase (GGDEF)-like protein